MQMKSFALGAALAISPCLLQAQISFRLAERQFQIHSFASQGFAYSNQNNYLTMKTTDGSAAMTDGGVNISTQLTDKFRVGAQVYDRNLGNLGNWHATLDWAFADYRFKDWFGIRGGKVKTALGLYNDTQDQDFLRTWALLPQSIYPLDLRDTYLSHTGADIYGTISLHKGGSLSYTAYAGTRSNDTHGGFYYGDKANGSPLSGLSGISGGGDVRWETPMQGLTVGASHMVQTMNADGVLQKVKNAPFHTETDSPQQITAVYGDYSRWRLHFTGEYRRNHSLTKSNYLGITARSDFSEKSGFAAVAFRVTKRLEIGTYNSRYYINHPKSTDVGADHIFDQTVTARFDIARFWNVKVEAHFIDGFGDKFSAHGFYTPENPAGFMQNTRLLVVRTGWNF